MSSSKDFYAPLTSISSATMLMAISCGVSELILIPMGAWTALKVSSLTPFAFQIVIDHSDLPFAADHAHVFERFLQGLFKHVGVMLMASRDDHHVYVRPSDPAPRKPSRNLRQ